MTDKDQSAPSDASSLLGCGKDAVASADDRDRWADALDELIVLFGIRSDACEADARDLAKLQRYFDAERELIRSDAWLRARYCVEKHKRHIEHKHSVTEGR